VKATRAELEASAAGPEGFPKERLPEVALLGRSNVGKSTLLNRMVGRRRLAHTSRTPGKTRLAHFYRVERGGERLRLVDLPGYGFARVARAERARWRGLVEGYLGGREQLRVAVLLQDARRDAGEDEVGLLAWLEERGVASVLALTKMDALAASERARRTRELAAALGVPEERAVATSGATGEGIDALWRAVARFL
jgi:GTP-binding protein